MTRSCHASDAAATLPSDDVTSNWHCPCCLEQGVSVWHGCSRRLTSAFHPLVTPPSLPLKSCASISSPSSSPQVLALREAVDDLKTHCASLESRLDAIETTLHNLVVGHASTEATLDSVVVSPNYTLYALILHSTV
ncbi:hypothetical protein E2C01_099029 [Portunus trituberculatus]|uniref:Uncharacterized protein n=1 Tax=Portunus trituberculatus TaxID=210409 RepID=A0A5B7K2R7_PORTR|nr:hypothetical protein [Portunus trituberculatus]